MTLPWTTNEGTNEWRVKRLRKTSNKRRSKVERTHDRRDDRYWNLARTHINDSKMAMALEVVASSTLPLPPESQKVLCYAKIQQLSVL